MTKQAGDGSLRDFLLDLERAVTEGSPSDSCVLCGSTTRLLHPVGRAWACSRCHTAPADEPTNVIPFPLEPLTDRTVR